MEQENLDDLNLDGEGGRFSLAFAVLCFAVGAAAGLLLAFSGFGFLSDSATVIAAVFLIVIGVVGLGGIAVFALRRRILKAVFGIAEAQVNVIAGPLAGVAQGAARRDPEQAAQSARRLIQVALARYSWLATRRWILTTLTALIAAMAALAGTALLFKQNALIAEQIVLLGEQNTRIAQQTVLLEQQTELAEAARNAALSVEVTAVAALLGEAVDRSLGPLETRSGDVQVPVLDPARDLERSVLFRLVAVSQALRPYRFLQPAINVADDNDRMRIAMLARREVMPGVWQRLSEQNGWRIDEGPSQLIDRIASPERGQLLRVMLGNGLRETEVLNFYGLDLSFAFAQGLIVPVASMQNAALAYADLSWGSLAQTDLRGAVLANIRLRHAQVLRSRLGALPLAEARGPYAGNWTDGAPSRLTGADFTGALIVDTDFSGADALGAVFDGALIAGADFSGAELGAASFRGALLVGAVWRGAGLQSVDLDGAVMVGADPLADLTAQSQPGTFDATRYRAERADLAEVYAAQRWATPDLADLIRRTGGAPAWRLVRVAPFR